jgi:hypothetical protein
MVKILYIFQLKDSGTNQTTYYTTKGVDLSNIFQPYHGTNTKAQPTKILVNGNELCNIFQNSVNNAKTNYNPFSTSLTLDIHMIYLKHLLRIPLQAIYQMYIFY